MSKSDNKKQTHEKPIREDKRDKQEQMPQQPSVPTMPKPTKDK